MGVVRRRTGSIWATAAAQERVGGIWRAATATVSVSAATPAPTGVAGQWTLMFNDDFNGTTLDDTKWVKNWYNGVNNVVSSATNIVVSGGNLALTLSSPTTGAIVTTKPSGTFTGFQIAPDCVWEARILLPANGSVVYNWPAFWVLRDNGDADTCEIDIAEVWEGVMQNAYHCSGIHAEKKYTGYLDGQFHIWTMRRTSTTMYFYVDGTLMYTLPKAAGDLGTPQYCILNVGRTSSGNNNVYGSKMLVDYVRAWKPAP